MRHNPTAMGQPDDPYSTDSITKEFLKLSVQDSTSVDRHFSKEILQIPTKDRNAITEEIHGVSTLAPEESPALREAALRNLAEELDRIPDDDPSKLAYVESQFFPHTYVNTREFRLRFLRCELFDAAKAAQRMLTFLEVASGLFGPRVLERPMRLSDFTAEDKKIFNRGLVHVLPYRDQTGRPVAVLHRQRMRQLSYYKVGLYLSYTMSECVESQQKGCVQIMWVSPDASSSSSPKDGGTSSGGESTTASESENDSSNEQTDKEKYVFEDMKSFGNAFASDNKKFFGAQPLRISVYHFCMPETPINRIFQTGLRLAVKGKTSRVRMKFHCGEEVEMRYLLKTYGIPVELISLTKGRPSKTTFMKQWLRGRKLVEEIRDSSVILYPRSNDVLYRRGVSLTCHPGNHRFQGIIESRMLEHSHATIPEKKAITNVLIQSILQQGGRFLQWNSKGWWEEIRESPKIHAKVANQVKLFKFKPVAGRNQQTIRSSTGLFQNQDHASVKRRKISHEGSSDSENDECSTCFL